LRGRELFKMFKPVLSAAIWVLGLLPAGLSALALVLLRHFPTHLGVALRYVLISRLAQECGDVVAVFEGVYLKGLKCAVFGNDVSIHSMCYIDATGGLRIGSNVSIAHGTTIMTTEHDYTQPCCSTRDAATIMAPVVIGNDVWLGAGVRVLAGVSIGDHVVIGAGAVVTHDVASNTVVAGVPARPIKVVRGK